MAIHTGRPGHAVRNDQAFLDAEELDKAGFSGDRRWSAGGTQVGAKPVKTKVIQHSTWLAQPRQALGHRQLARKAENLGSAGATAGLVVLAFLPCFCPLATSASTGLLRHARTTKAAPEPTVSYRSWSLAVFIRAGIRRMHRMADNESRLSAEDATGKNAAVQRFYCVTEY